MDVDPGGKGNNAARAARLLGADVIATGLSGGFTGGSWKKD
jgi:fructose-1-phosphate kinase PfkB-like protein